MQLIRGMLSRDLVLPCRLVCDAPDRLGYRIDELKAHPFFHGTDWDHIRDRPAAIQVHVKHMADTSNFDDFEELDEKKRCKPMCVCVCVCVCVANSWKNAGSAVMFLIPPGRSA